MQALAAHILPSCHRPAAISIGFGNFGSCHNNTVTKNLRSFSAFSQCQIKPAVFTTALQKSQVSSALHKRTEIAEHPRVPATKLRSSSEEKAPTTTTHSL